MRFRKDLIEGADATSGWIDLTAHFHQKSKTVTLDRENRILLGSVVFNELRIDEPRSIVLLEKIQNGQLRISKKR